MRQTEIALTKRPVKITPATVHTIAIILATNDKGSRSPYLRRKHERKSLVTRKYSEAESVLGTGDLYIYIYMVWHSTTSL